MAKAPNYPSLEELLAAQKYASQGGPGAAISSGLEGVVSGHKMAFDEKLANAKTALERAQTNLATRKEQSNYVDADTANKQLGKQLFPAGTQVPYQTMDVALRA